MNITLTQSETQKAKQELNQITGFFLAFEEGDTTKERLESLHKSYPAFSKILDQVNNWHEEAPDKADKKTGKKDKEL